jgi:hypothetical protein
MPDPEADYTIDWDDDTGLPAVPVPPPAFRAPPPAPVAAVITPQDDRDLAVVHARAAKAEGSPVTEGAVVENSDTIELLGKRFRIADRIGLMPLLKYASASDMSTEDPRALAAIYSMLRDCIYPGTPACGDCDRCTAGNEAICKAYDAGDWQAFENHATDTKADAEELMPVISQVMEIITGRPTPPRGGSSATPRGTRRVSTASRSGARGRGSKG